MKLKPAAGWLWSSPMTLKREIDGVSEMSLIDLSVKWSQKVFCLHCSKSSGRKVQMCTKLNFNNPSVVNIWRRNCVELTASQAKQHFYQLVRLLQLLTEEGEPTAGPAVTHNLQNPATQPATVPPGDTHHLRNDHRWCRGTPKWWNNSLWVSLVWLDSSGVSVWRKIRAIQTNRRLNLEREKPSAFLLKC